MSTLHTLYHPWSPVSEAELARPALQTMMRFAETVPVPTHDPLQRQAYWLHQPIPVPVAPVTARIDLDGRFQPDAFYMRLDPVHLHPDRDTLVLFTARDAGMTAEEGRVLADAFNAHFAEEGIQVMLGEAADRWYVSLPQAVDLRTTPLHEARHANLHHVQPEGEAARLWRRLINEAQMLFHMHPVNERRRERNAPEINGLWLWGEGSLSQIRLRQRPELVCFSPSPFVQGLTRAMSARMVEALPTGLTDGIGEGDACYWDLTEVATATVLDTYLPELIENVRSGRIHSLVIDLGQPVAWHLTPGHFRRFWRRWRSPVWPGRIQAEPDVLPDATPSAGSA